MGLSATEIAAHDAACIREERFERERLLAALLAERVEGCGWDWHERMVFKRFRARSQAKTMAGRAAWQAWRRQRMACWASPALVSAWQGESA